MPCDILSLDAQDIMGTHIVNVEGKLLKRRIRDGKVLSEEVLFTKIIFSFIQMMIIMVIQVLILKGLMKRLKRRKVANYKDLLL